MSDSLLASTLITRVRISADAVGATSRHPDSVILRYLKDAATAITGLLSTVSRWPVVAYVASYSIGANGQVSGALGTTTCSAVHSVVLVQGDDRTVLSPLSARELEDYHAGQYVRPGYYIGPNTSATSGTRTTLTIVPRDTTGTVEVTRTVFDAAEPEWTGSTSLVTTLPETDEWVVLDAASRLAARDEELGMYEMLTRRRDEVYSRLVRYAAMGGDSLRRVDTWGRRRAWANRY